MLGSQIEEVHVLLDIGFYQARAGGNLARAYQGAISADLDEAGPELASTQVSLSLREGIPELEQAWNDLLRVAELRDRLGSSESGTSYRLLLDRYLPAIMTVAYLSRISPEVIGDTYVLSRELSSLQESVSDPLDVMADPEGVGEALRKIEERAIALESALGVVRRATGAGGTEEDEGLAGVNDVIGTLKPGVTLLRRVTAGTRGLVTMAEAMESSGFLSEEFGSVAGAALARSQRELTLAREEAASFQALLSGQGIEAEAFLPSVVFGSDSDVSISSTERVEALLDEAISATKFLTAFLGFEGSKIYLLLGQNQKEIRAGGGFIGIAVRATINRGQLTDLVFHDSTTVDRLPLTGNPTPPEGLFWYLWMGRLLFRDANGTPISRHRRPRWRKLQTKRGRQRYALRMQTVEPVFGLRFTTWDRG